jgi:SOS-response transcriptional repressor LexA
MHPVQRKLLVLARQTNLAALTLREMAERLELPTDSPQRVKHHLAQLERKGLLLIDRSNGEAVVPSLDPRVASNVGGSTSSPVFSIPVLGAANCGPAMTYAEENVEGFLRVSSRLLRRSKPTGLYAIRAVGNSMNRAIVNEKSLDDGDYAVVESRRKTPKNGEVVVVVIDGRAAIKCYHDDRKHGQIVLHAASSTDYDPIHLHPDDTFAFSGVVVDVVKGRHR